MPHSLEFEKLASLVELAEMLNQQDDFDEVLRLVVRKAVDLFHADTAMVLMVNPQTRQTVQMIQKQGREISERGIGSAQTHISGWMIKNRQPFFSEDLKSDPRFKKDLFKNTRTCSAMGALLITEGIILGTILLFAQKFAREDEPFLQKYAHIAAPFLRNVQRIQSYFKRPFQETELLAKYRAIGLLGKGKSFLELLHAIEAAARCDVRVLLEGPSGSGKELVAKAIHLLSSRRDGPFIAIDCGAIPANLLESELFGHVKGAFTGATISRKGLLEEADKGTLFMDEIANFPLQMQAKFMRVLQEGEIRPVGSNKTRSIDVRFISASSTSLRELVDKQQFREDLYFRLHVYPIPVPHLDDRREDIPLLANHFLNIFAVQQRKQARAFHEEIMDFMQQRHWPGNIRELENFVERLVTHTPIDSKIIDKEVLPKELRKELKKFVQRWSAPQAAKSLHEQLAKHEEQILRDSLLSNNWNQSKTARMLKISEQTLRYKMGKLGIFRERT